MATFKNGENYSNRLEILNNGPILDLRFKMKKHCLHNGCICRIHNRLEIMTETTVTSYDLALLTFDKMFIL